MTIIRVTLRCPQCHHVFVGGEIHPGTWWSKGLTPQHVAQHPYCERCHCPPPMQVVEPVEAQPSLF